ncbi:MAG: hypothetical protein Q8O30_11915 [Candidatus Omnitrophota bacterium]|nr:hypothetical protein [Candidatus Omnitrophota bacterium]
MAIGKYPMRFIKLFSLVFIILAAINCYFPSSAFSKEPPTLKRLLRQFFGETKDPRDIQGDFKEKKNFRIKRVWDALGFTKQDLCWPDPYYKELCLFGKDPIVPLFQDHAEPLTKAEVPEKANIRYQLDIFSGRKIRQDIAILSLENIEHPLQKEQWFIFEELNDDWAYKGSIMDDSGEVESLNDENGQFFIRGVSGVCARVSFYRLIDDKLMRVLHFKNYSGYDFRYKTRGYFEAVFWPGFYFRKDGGIGLTYFINYYAYYGWEEHKGDILGHYLFSVQKNVVFMWNADKKQYVFDPKRSQMTEKEFNSLGSVAANLDLLKAEGEAYYDKLYAAEYARDEDFYTLYKNEIEKTKINGDKKQKEWATDFERHLKEDKIVPGPLQENRVK